VGHESLRGFYTSEVWGPTAAQKGCEGQKDLGNTGPATACATGTGAYPDHRPEQLYEGGAAPDHLGIHVHPVGVDASHCPAMAIGVLHLNPHVSPEGKIGQRLAGARAVGLPAFKGVEFG
jgi:hypothetical protein